MTDIHRSAIAADPRDRIREAPMSRFQKMAVGVTVGLAALDGFDVLAVTLAAPGITREWGIDYGALGAIFASGFVGMTLGALFMAPAADIYGRRRVLFLSLALMCVGMFAGGLAPNVSFLVVARFIAGLGIGAMLSIVNPLATEFASSRGRDLAVSIMAIGYPIGGVIGAASASLLLTYLDWRAIFHLGAVLAIAAVPIVWRWLPEPISFLIERPRSDSLAKVNAVLDRCNLPKVSVLPPPSAPGRSPTMALFMRDRRGVTLCVILINLLFVVPVQYILSWLPQLVADLGFAPAQAATVSLSANIAGIFGGIALGWAAGKVGVQRLGVMVFIVFGILCFAFSLAPADLVILRLLAVLLGLFLFAGMSTLHAIVSRAFPDHLRASGAGIVFGIGRAGSSISPLIVGLLFASGVGRETLSAAMAISAVAAALLLVALNGARRSPQLQTPTHA